MRNLKNRVVISLLALIPLLGQAHEDGGKRIEILRDQPLSDAPGQRGVMLTVQFAPGYAAAPHVHAGSVLAYVLEGSVVTQSQGGPAQTFKAGESWYEAPGVPHVQARNASDKLPAKLLVWQLLPEGEPVARPLK